MSTWTSSLRPRRESVVAGVCLAVLAWPAAAGAAGGTPMPAPDDPPVTSTLSAGTAPAPKTGRAVESAQPVPTPDAPFAGTSNRTGAPARHTAPAPRPDATSPSPVAASLPVAKATTRARRPAAPTTAKATSTRHAGEVRAPAPARVKRRSGTPVHRAIIPRDAVRLGLPVGVLAAGPPGGGASRVLLLVAAFLFAVAAGGSTVLGAAARGAARHA